MTTLFNNKQLHLYIDACHTILEGKAVPSLFYNGEYMSVVHICFAHVMKCFSKRLKLPKIEKKFMMFALSALSSTATLDEYHDLLYSILIVFLSRYKIPMFDEAKKKIDDICAGTTPRVENALAAIDEGDSDYEDQDLISDDEIDDRPKRSIFFQTAKDLLDRVRNSLPDVSNQKNRKGKGKINEKKW